MTPKVLPKPRMTSEERKASIVREACRLFAEKGFRGTTTRELAAAVGVTEPVLYEHFKTKRDIYSAIIETKAQHGLDYVASLRETHSGTWDDRSFFNKLGNSIVDWFTKDPEFPRLLLYSSLEGHELKELFHERTSACSGAISGYIGDRIAQGAMRGMEPAIAARAFFGMVAHYAITALVFGHHPFARPSSEVVAEMVDIFLNGMYAEDHQQ